MKTYTLEELRLAQAKGCRIEILVDGVWMELKNPEFKEPDDVCRIHPADEWKARLPRLKEGAEWHRNDFTNEMLEDGYRSWLYRPLLKGETARHGDNGRGFRDIEWLDVIGDGKIDCDPDYYFRTRRPVPPEFLHPDELTKRQPSKERGCDGKANLGSDYAKQADRMAAKHGKQYGVYHCPHCGGHHLTTKLENQGYYEPLLYVTQIAQQPEVAQAPDFGEPWQPSCEMIFDRDGDYVAEFQPPFHDSSKVAARAIACTNALRGVPDPTEFVRQAKEMQRKINRLEWELAIQRSDIDTARRIEREGGLK